VLPEDLKINSPYNTYSKVGLPPAPIAMPDITALEAVLQPDKNDFLFFALLLTDLVTMNLPKHLPNT